METELQRFLQVGFGLVQDGGELGHLGADLIGDSAPLAAGRFGRLLCEGGGDQGTGHSPPVLASISRHIAHEVNSAALSRGAEDLGDSGLDGLVGIGGFGLG